MTRFRTPRTALTRYVLYQIPGGLLAAAGALLLHRWVGLPGWVAIALGLVAALLHFPIDERPVARMVEQQQTGG